MSQILTPSAPSFHMPQHHHQQQQQSHQSSVNVLYGHSQAQLQSQQQQQHSSLNAAPDMVKAISVGTNGAGSTTVNMDDPSTAFYTAMSRTHSSGAFPFAQQYMPAQSPNFLEMLTRGVSASLFDPMRQSSVGMGGLNSGAGLSFNTAALFGDRQLSTASAAKTPVALKPDAAIDAHRAYSGNANTPQQPNAPSVSEGPFYAAGGGGGAGAGNVNGVNGGGLANMAAYTQSSPLPSQQLPQQQQQQLQLQLQQQMQHQTSGYTASSPFYSGLNGNQAQQSQQQFAAATPTLIGPLPPSHGGAYGQVSPMPAHYQQQVLNLANTGAGRINGATYDLMSRSVSAQSRGFHELLDQQRSEESDYTSSRRPTLSSVGSPAPHNMHHLSPYTSDGSSLNVRSLPMGNGSWNTLPQGPMPQGAIMARPVARASAVPIQTNSHAIVSVSAELDSHAARAQPTLMEVNNIVRKVFVCPVPNCGRALTTRFNYKRHTKRHTGEKQFQCEYSGCGKRFAEKSSMKRHLKVHDRKRDKRSSTSGTASSSAGSSARKSLGANSTEMGSHGDDGSDDYGTDGAVGVSPMASGSM